MMEVPEYPLPSDARLPTHSWFAVDHDKLIQSTFYKKAALDVQGMGLRLWAACQREIPVGTLPDDREELAIIGRVSLDVWDDLAGRKITPMHGWMKCITSDGEVRLYNPTMLEVVREKWESHIKAISRGEQGRVRTRVSRIRKMVTKAGGTQAMADDRGLLERLDEWLEQNWDGSRGVEAIRQALEHDAMRDQSMVNIRRFPGTS